MHRLSNVEARAAAKAGIATHTLSAGYGASAGYIANSSYSIFNALWQSRFQLPGESKIDLQLGYNNKDYGANTFYSARFPNQYEQTSTYLGSVKGEFGSTLKFIPIIYWSRHYDHFDLTKGSEAGRNFHRNDTYGANLILAYRSKLGTTSLGAELREENITSSVLGKPIENPDPQSKYSKRDNRTNASLTLEHTLAWRQWSLSAGALLYHTSLIKDEYDLYPSLSLAYRPVDRLKLSASWSKSTRMPTFTDLYYTTETHNGNSGLRPEKSESLDAGLNYSNGAFRAHLTGFLLWGKDMIDWVKADPQDAKWASWNHTKVNTQGLEAGIGYHRLGDILPFLGRQSSISIDYTRMHEDSDTQGLISVYALNYLRDKLAAQFNHQLLWEGLSASWYFRCQKRMGTYEKFENQAKVGDEPFPAFSTLDLALNYRLRNMTFHLNLNNLYDTYYFDKGNIPQPGLWLTGGISWRIN
jgi:iron complex outermembrane receptor protein